MPLYVMGHYHIHDANVGGGEWGHQRGTGGRGRSQTGEGDVPSGPCRGTFTSPDPLVPPAPKSSERAPDPSREPERSVPGAHRRPWVALRDGGVRPTRNLFRLTFHSRQGRCGLQAERRRRERVLRKKTKAAQRGKEKGTDVSFFFFFFIHSLLTLFSSVCSL